MTTNCSCHHQEICGDTLTRLAAALAARKKPPVFFFFLSGTNSSHYVKNS